MIEPYEGLSLIKYVEKFENVDTCDITNKYGNIKRTSDNRILKRIIGGYKKNGKILQIWDRLEVLAKKDMRISPECSEYSFVSSRESVDNDIVFLAMSNGGKNLKEWISSRNAFQSEISRDEELLRLNIVLKAAKCLDSFHEQGYVHRDIHCENFLYNSKTKDAVVYLIDFEKSQKADDPLNDGTIGAPYKDPVLIPSSGVYKKQSNFLPKNDLFSFGCVMFSVLGNNGNSILERKEVQEYMEIVEAESTDPRLAFRNNFKVAKFEGKFKWVPEGLIELCKLLVSLKIGRRLKDLQGVIDLCLQLIERVKHEEEDSLV